MDAGIATVLAAVWDGARAADLAHPGFCSILSTAGSSRRRARPVAGPRRHTDPGAKFPTGRRVRRKPGDDPSQSPLERDDGPTQDRD
jgi:hypothetical protein